jgi:hypothetical protein
MRATAAIVRNGGGRDENGGGRDELRSLVEEEILRLNKQRSREAQCREGPNRLYQSLRRVYSLDRALSSIKAVIFRQRLA